MYKHVHIHVYTYTCTYMYVCMTIAKKWCWSGYINKFLINATNYHSMYMYMCMYCSTSEGGFLYVRRYRSVELVCLALGDFQSLTLAVSEGATPCYLWQLAKNQYGSYKVFGSYNIVCEYFVIFVTGGKNAKISIHIYSI